MRRILVNALSVTNPSGLHVLRGHLEQLVEGLAGGGRFRILCRADMADLREAFADRVDWVFAPAATRGWFFRAVWERIRLAHLARRHGADAYFTPSGIAAHLPPELPQVVLCQNPWALVPAARRRRNAAKAWLQRRAYRRTMRAAAAMVFNSRYMQAAYRRNAGFEERRGLVVHQAADEATRARAAAWAGAARRPGRILCVSIMAPHKNAEAVVRALARLRPERPEAHLMFAGSWPDAAYERRIRGLVAALGLGAAVEFAGFVPRDRLDQLYAESRVFCLMSRCESFGIPAIEAQGFGTPVVSSTAGAIPEICGAGGIYRDPDDVEGVAAALRTLIADDAAWAQCSAAARENAARFSWAECSRPLVELLRGDIAASPGGRLPA